MAAKGEMAAEIGHELSNYLQIISGRSQMLVLEAGKSDNPKLERDARMIFEQAANMAILTRGLMDFSYKEIKIQRVDVSDLISRTVEFVRPQNKYDTVEFELDLAETLCRALQEGSGLRPFVEQRLADLLELTAIGLVDLREMQLEPVERRDDGGADHDAGEPFVVGRHDIPRRMLGGGAANRIFVGLHVIVPEAALANVVGGKFPVFLRLIEAREKALFLLAVRYMQKELQDDDAVAREVALEPANVAMALLPNIFGDQIGREFLGLEQLPMDAHDERLLVVAAVE